MISFRFPKHLCAFGTRTVVSDQGDIIAIGRTTGAGPGYVVDHVEALKHGGVDEPGNMRWQTVDEAKAKDRIE